MEGNKPYDKLEGNRYCDNCRIFAKYKCTCGNDLCGQCECPDNCGGSVL